jgi:formylglycine-generating enzyme required for sulfatase activity
MVEFAADSFAIGAELSAAEFYSQHPRFRIRLDAFAIDPEVVSRDELLAFRSDFVFPDTRSEGVATHVTFEEAAGYCKWRSKRLPTEFEWEVAVGGAKVEPGLLEWTSSWYKPYPGNDVPEEEYGERFRVLRGAPEPGQLDPRRRRFAAPGARHPRLGFRCARDIEAS